MCEAKGVGLVRYPTTLAQASGSVAVTTQCADNARVINSTSLNVTCTSNSTWVGQTPQCQCDDGYHEVRVNGTHICQGKHKSTEKYNSYETFHLRVFFKIRLFR